MKQMQMHDGVEVFQIEDLGLLIVTQQPLPEANRQNGLDKQFNAASERHVAQWPLIFPANKLTAEEQNELKKKAVDYDPENSNVEISFDEHAGKFLVTDTSTQKTTPFYLGAVGLNNLKEFHIRYS